MLRSVLLILSLVLTSTVLNARTVRGVVLSTSDSAAVVGASCRLMVEGKLITGTLTDSEGAFSLTDTGKEPATIEIAMTGFSPTKVLIESGTKNLDLGVLFLNEGLSLSEVTVTGGSVVQSKGRTIVYPSAADVKSSSSAISLFMKLPLDGMEANPINRTLTVDGGTPVILINGVPSTNNDVHSIQPRDIEKIEYSRFTPARYADKGGSGFINIVLKKRSDGGLVYLWARSALTTTFVDGHTNASYHQGRSQFTISYDPTWRNYHDVFDTSKESLVDEADNIHIKLLTAGRTPFCYNSQPIRLKYDYSNGLRTLFSATFRVTPGYSNRKGQSHTYNSELGEYDEADKSTSKTFGPTLDLFLRHNFNDANSLEAQVVGSLSTDRYRRENRYVYPDAKDNETYRMDADSRRMALVSEVSYIHQFSQSTELSGGWQNTVSRSTNTYLTDDYKPLLTENNNYIYARLGQNIDKVYFAVSTGAKLFWINNADNRRHFFRNLTNAQVVWYPSRSVNVQASFSFTPFIPSLTNLTDYPQQVSHYLISNGNPDLKASYNFNYALQAGYTYRKLTASLRGTVSDTRNSVFNDWTYIGNGMFLSQPINSRLSRSYRGSLYLNLADVAGFGANLGLNLSHYQSAGAEWSHSLTSFSATMSLWYSFDHFTVSYWRKFPGKYLQGHYVQKEENGDALQVEYRPNKHWTLGASWQYMFESKGTRYPSWCYSSVNPGESLRTIHNNANMVVLTATYVADFGSIFRTARRTLNNSGDGSSLLKL